MSQGKHGLFEKEFSMQVFVADLQKLSTEAWCGSWESLLQNPKAWQIYFHIYVTSANQVESSCVTTSAGAGVAETLQQ